MSIIAECGSNVSSIVHALHGSEDIYPKNNLTYDGWTLFHCAANMANKNVIKYFLVIKGESIDIEASNPWHEYERTPRSILAYKYPQLLLELEQEGLI
jgi:hypothetical protein